MNEIKNVTFEVGEVVTPLKSAKTYAKDKKFEDFELSEIAEGLRGVAQLENVTAIEIAYRLLAVKEHAKNAEQLGKLIGKEKADIYEFSKAVTGKSKGRTSEYIKVAETFRYRDNKDKYIPNKEKYYLDEVASAFNFDTLLLIAKSKELDTLSKKYEFLATLPESITALEVREKLIDMFKEEQTEEEQTEEVQTEEQTEVATEEQTEVIAIDFNELTATLRNKLASYIKTNVGEGVDNIRIYNITY